MTNWRDQAIQKIQSEIDRVRANYAEAALDAAIEAVIEQLRMKQSRPVAANENAGQSMVACQMLTMQGSRYDWTPLCRLGVGASVFLPYRMVRPSVIERKRAKAQAGKAAADWAKRTGRRFTSRELPEGIRVYRVA